MVIFRTLRFAEQGNRLPTTSKGHDMKQGRYSVLVAAVVAAASIVIAGEKGEKTSASGTSADAHKAVDPADLQWAEPPPGLPTAVKVAVLVGDPAKKGPFTVRLRVPAGGKILPHTHSMAEHITVLSGIFHIGTGDKFDENVGHTMGPGSFMTIPANTKHFAWATEESVVQVHADGPFAIAYVNPADDPRNAKK